MCEAFILLDLQHMLGKLARVTKEQPNPTKLRTSSTSIRINKSTWEKHSPRIKRDFYVRDTKLEGYYIRIRPNGKKTYCIQTKLGGVGRPYKIYKTLIVIKT